MSLIQNTNRRAYASSTAAFCAAAGASCSGSCSGWRGMKLSSGTLSLRVGFGG